MASNRIGIQTQIRELSDVSLARVNISYFSGYSVVSLISLRPLSAYLKLRYLL